jgi:AraC family transcriptional regulator, regulatory protein of adaptative response / DNA-3-methyladenine glycosylase II
MPLDADRCYAAVEARDPRFDGRFFTGVTSTGVFCRPICPARTPGRDRVCFFPSAAAALTAGFRPCRRCRPEAAPGSAAWRGSAAVVDQALAAIDDGALDDGADAPALAGRLGVSDRHLRRLFLHEVGATPAQVARARRVLVARRLLADTTLPVTEVAFAAGFGSVRQFNDVVRGALGMAPTEVRASHHAPPPGGDRFVLTLRVPARPPFDWDDVLAFLAPRALPGVEEVGTGRYERGVPGGRIRLTAAPGGLAAAVDLASPSDLPALLRRVRDLTDADTDTAPIAARLQRVPVLAPRVAACPGRRVVGAFDRWETAVRVVLGQQVSVAAARTLAGRLVVGAGRMPNPDELPEAVAALGMPAARRRALATLAGAVAAGDLDLDGDRDRARATLGSLPGIGPWTAEVLALRVLRDPDAFPATDLGVRRALGETVDPAAWSEPLRPWRAYATAHLWAPEPEKDT